MIFTNEAEQPLKSAMMHDKKCIHYSLSLSLYRKLCTKFTPFGSRLMLKRLFHLHVFSGFSITPAPDLKKLTNILSREKMRRIALPIVCAILQHRPLNHFFWHARRWYKLVIVLVSTFRLPCFSPASVRPLESALAQCKVNEFCLQLDAQKKQITPQGNLEICVSYIPAALSSFNLIQKIIRTIYPKADASEDQG